MLHTARLHLYIYRRTLYTTPCVKSNAILCINIAPGNINTDVGWNGEEKMVGQAFTSQHYLHLSVVTGVMVLSFTLMHDFQKIWKYNKLMNTLSDSHHCEILS